MARKRIRALYAIQNVGNIDFSQDLGDTVPVKHALTGLKESGVDVKCLMLRERSVVGVNDIDHLDNVWYAPSGLTATRPFMYLESGFRRLQRQLRLPYYALFDLFRFYEACIRCLPEYDLCHEHNGLFYGGAALACSRMGKPYVLTVSADPFLERANMGKPVRGLQRLVAAWEARLAYRVASKIICVSETAKLHLVESWQVDPEKIVVMPNGVDTELFKPCDNSQAMRSELSLGDGPVIGFVGAFHPWHGLDILVESFARVLVEFPDARLLLVGDGRARPLVDRVIAEYGLHSSVIVTGIVPQARVPALLAAADIAVLPYPKFSKELWFSPLKLYEYMAAARAIVASNSGQIAEVIQHGHTGLLIEPGDVAALTHALSQLIRDPAERERLGRNARSQALEKHSWDFYIRRLEEVYMGVL